MSRVLVTGGGGFIGRQACAQLVAGGYSVHLAGRLRPRQLPEGLSFHPVDLLADRSAAGLIATVQPSHLLHLAWNATPGVFWSAPDNLAWVAASLALYRAFAQAGGKRAVFAGSCAEYDWSQPVLSDRSTPLEPATLYGACKDALRRTLEKAAIQDGVSLAWGRIFWLYGPGEQPGRLVSDLIAGLLAGREVPCTEGSQSRDFMHVADVGRALVQLLSSEATGAVNIASGRATRVADLIALTAELAGGSGLVRLGALPMGKNQPAILVGDAERLANEVGFRPHFGLRDGLADTISWHRQMLALNPRQPGPGRGKT